MAGLLRIEAEACPGNEKWRMRDSRAVSNSPPRPRHLIQNNGYKVPINLN